MNCPKDHSPMIVVEYDQIAIDYCPECRGVWLDRGELELVVEKSFPVESVSRLEDFFHRREADVKEDKRRCPICHQTMHKEKIGTAPEVVIDACVAREDGLWFDGGELQQVLSQLQTGDISPAGEMITFLREALKADTAD
ncbi:MAG: zf-TFIIB domain-containing protein [Dehalogenimonas sp.]